LPGVAAMERQMTDMLQDSGQLARVGPVVHGCADSL
jgi:hypothetical protein